MFGAVRAPARVTEGRTFKPAMSKAQAVQACDVHGVQNKIFDVIIVGSGPAGCAVALSLFKHKQAGSFVIIGDSDPSSFKIGESLPPESAQLLHNLLPSLVRDLYDHISSGKHLLCTGNASAWASSILEDRHAIFNPFGHGLHLDRAAFDEQLCQGVNECCAATNARSALVKGKFKGAHKDPEGNWCVQVDVHGETTTFGGRWIIDATGRKASVATKLGAKTITSSPLLAFYALFSGPSQLGDPDAEVDTDHRTIIEATPDGWFYSALLPHDSTPTRLVAFHTLPSHPVAKRARRPEEFLDLVQSSASNISGIIESTGYAISPGRGFPRCTAAGTSFLDKPCDMEAHWIAVGDAAMSFDPLSSQGMMTALEMGTYVGLVLALLIDGVTEEAKECVRLAELYRKVRLQYEQHRAYYYGSVRRFDGEEFWKNVIPPT